MSSGSSSSSLEAAPLGAPRVRPNVLVTGTPGTGKTTASELIAEAAGLEHVNVGDVVKAEGLHSGYDEEHAAYVLDEDAVVDALEERLSRGGVLVDHHGCDFFPERWFDLVVVLRAGDTATLWNRLEARGYAEEKIRENVQCEIMRVVVDEAMESYDPSIVQVLESETTEQMEENVDRVVRWCQAFENERARGR